MFYLKQQQQKPLRSPGSRQTVSPLEHLYENHYHFVCYINSHILPECSIINNLLNETPGIYSKIIVYILHFCLDNFYFTVTKSTVYLKVWEKTVLIVVLNK